MAVTYANVFNTTLTDGIIYAASKTLTTSEVSIFNQTSPPGIDPVPVLYGQAVIGIGVLTVTGTPDTNSTYIVLQTSNDGGTTWFDLAWFLWTGVTGTATFELSGGAAGANSVQQSRASGTAPSSNGSNQTPLGGLFRFVGKKVVTGGTAPAVTISLRYKLLGLR